MGIALGSTLPGCMGNTTSDEEADGALDGEEPLVAALCDVSWPPTKGNPDPGTPMCIDPAGECADAPLPTQCYALIGIDTCDRDREYMDPLQCVDGEWQCPPGSTKGWACEGDACINTCECWGPLAEGETCPSGASRDGGD
jgi:hypothetical protein